MAMAVWYCFYLISIHSIDSFNIIIDNLHSSFKLLFYFFHYRSHSGPHVDT